MCEGLGWGMMGEQGWGVEGEQGWGVVGKQGWGVVRHRPHAQGLRGVSLEVKGEGAKAGMEGKGAKAKGAKAGRERVEWRVEGWG